MWIVWGKLGILSGVIREGVTEKVTVEQRPDCELLRGARAPCSPQEQ